MKQRDIGQEILEGIREIKAYKIGKKILRTRRIVAKRAVRRRAAHGTVSV